MVKILLKSLAQKRNKTISDIARETGINRNTITSLFHEKVDGVKFSTLEKICDTYQIDISELITHKTEKNQEKKGGVYAQEAMMVPFFAWSSIENFNNLDLRFFNFGYGTLYGFFKNGYAKAYYEKENMDKLAHYIYDTFDGDRFDELYRAYVHDTKELQDMYFAYERNDIVQFNETELRDFFTQLMKKYQRFWKIGLCVDSFDSGTDQEIISEVAERYGMSINDIGVLTTPDKMTYNNEKLLALLEIVQHIKSRRIIRDDLKSFLDTFISESDLIQTYKKNFDYYKSNYHHIEFITDQEIKEEIVKYYNDPILLKEKLHDLNQYTSIRNREKQKVLKKLGLKDNPLEFFAELTYWREHRKQINLMGIHLVNYVLESLERLTGIPIDNLKYASFDEFDGILKGLVKNDALIKRREDGFALIVEKEGYKIIEDDQAKSLQDEKEREFSDGKKERIINGFVASQGYAKGIAKVVLDTTSFDNFEEGDILITGMTRPEFVPLMKKAAGIVTNEGGITCHAAIVSRELGKPCIIGTQNATQEIQDGDLVEVRANHGTVRVLSS